MNNSFARLVDGMCATLRDVVLPKIDDAYARSQVFGLINLLNTFQVRADWSAGFLRQQIAAQRDALGAAATLAAPAPAPLPPAPEADVDIAGLLAARDEHNRALQAWLAWLDSDGAGHAQRAAVEAAVLTALRAEVDIELKHSPRPLFAEMSGEG